MNQIIFDERLLERNLPSIRFNIVSEISSNKKYHIMSEHKIRRRRLKHFPFDRNCACSQMRDHNLRNWQIVLIDNNLNIKNVRIDLSKDYSETNGFNNHAIYKPLHFLISHSLKQY